MNVDKPVEYRLQRVYEYASLVEECVESPDNFIEIFGGQTDVLDALVKPCKVSLLHHFIYSMIRVNTARRYRKDGDLYDESDASELLKICSEYGIDIMSFKNFCKNKSEMKQVEEFYSVKGHFPFYLWFLHQEDGFSELWGFITEEVFHLLFSNRHILLTFNDSLAEYLVRNKDILPENILASSGSIKRASYIPTWLRSAVYCRDHGRCVLCQKDLTCLLSTDRKLHYDHIVPLKRMGTNDPVNFQLLCEKCNLDKSDSAGKTSLFYPPWWIK